MGGIWRTTVLSTAIWAFLSVEFARADKFNLGYVNAGGPEVFLEPAPSYGAPHVADSNDYGYSKENHNTAAFLSYGYDEGNLYGVNVHVNSKHPSSGTLYETLRKTFSAGYGHPAPSYGAPAPSYGAPAPSYGAPAPSYGAGHGNYAPVKIKQKPGGGKLLKSYGDLFKSGLDEWSKGFKAFFGGGKGKFYGPKTKGDWAAPPVFGRYNLGVKHRPYPNYNPPMHEYPIQHVFHPPPPEEHTYAPAQDSYAPPPADDGPYDAPADTYSAPTDTYAAPPPSYRAPAPRPSYGAPAPAPQPAYGAPAPAPQSTYGAPAPQPSYNAPAPQTTYGAPAPVPQSTYGAPAPAPQSTYGAPAPVDSYNAPANVNSYSGDNQAGNAGQGTGSNYQGSLGSDQPVSHAQPQVPGPGPIYNTADETPVIQGATYVEITTEATTPVPAGIITPSVGPEVTTSVSSAPSVTSAGQGQQTYQQQAIPQQQVHRRRRPTVTRGQYQQQSQQQEYQEVGNFNNNPQPSYADSQVTQETTGRRRTSATRPSASEAPSPGYSQSGGDPTRPARRPSSSPTQTSSYSPSGQSSSVSAAYVPAPAGKEGPLSSSDNSNGQNSNERPVDTNDRNPTVAPALENSSEVSRPSVESKVEVTTYNTNRGRDRGQGQGNEAESNTTSAPISSSSGVTETVDDKGQKFDVYSNPADIVPKVQN